MYWSQVQVCCGGKPTNAANEALVSLYATEWCGEIVIIGGRGNRVDRNS
jgi:hypothetical protein